MNFDVEFGSQYKILPYRNPSKNVSLKVESNIFYNYHPLNDMFRKEVSDGAVLANPV